MQPQVFIRELVGRKVNANDGTGAGAGDSGSDSEAENAASEESKKRRVGKGKKRTAALLNETMSQMPQIAGTSMGVYCNYEGAEVIEVLAERQEKALLAAPFATFGGIAISLTIGNDFFSFLSCSAGIFLM